MRPLICLVIVLMAAVCSAAEVKGLSDSMRPDPLLVEPSEKGGHTPRANMGSASPEEAPIPEEGEAQPAVSNLMDVNGSVIEKGSRRPLADMAVYIKDDQTAQIKATLTTDHQGRFHVRLPAGAYDLIIAAMGYDKLEKKIEIQNHPLDDLRLWLIPKVINPYQMVVRQKKRSVEVSGQHVTGQEANQTAGSSRDVLTSVKNMPGISSVTAFNGYGDGLIIRGSEQEDSIISIGDHSIPAYYHFGGFESILEPELVASIDYIAGGFSAEYGDALGGVVSMNIREPRTDRMGGYVNLSWMSASFLLEGPIGEKDSLAFGMKRGFLDYYMQLVEKADENNENRIDYVEYPSYYDATALYSHSIASDNQIKLVGIGSYDGLEVIQDDEAVSERYSDRISYDNRFATLLGEWERKEGGLKSVFSPMVTCYQTQIDQGERAYFKQTVNQFALSEKLVYRPNPTHRWSGGVRLTLDNADLDANYFAPPKEGEIAYNYYDEELRIDRQVTLFYPAVFIMDQIQRGPWTITPGLNASYDTYNEHELVDPRFSLKYQLTPSTALKGATGLYSRRPGLDESIAPWGTRGLKPERSIHGVLGVEHQLSDALSLDLQGYYKHLDDLVVRIDETDPSRYANEGSGRIYGAEILLRHQMTDNFFGWLSYTYSVARRKDGPNEAERYFDSDITHDLKTVLNYKPSRYWSFGLRYEYASGKPYTDLLDVETVYDVDSDTYRPLYDGSVNNERLKPHHQLDLRIDKYWLFNHFILSTYIDVRNVLQSKNEIGIDYNRDYTDSEKVYSVSSTVPLIFFGIKVDF
jgi:hypothetical protein